MKKILELKYKVAGAIIGIILGLLIGAVALYDGINGSGLVEEITNDTVMTALYIALGDIVILTALVIILLLSLITVIKNTERNVKLYNSDTRNEP